MSLELKVKSKHLGEEAKIIRFEEKRVLEQARYHREKGDFGLSNYSLLVTYVRLANHRKWDVRNENRATFLARAFLKGQKYSQVEQKCLDKHKRGCYIYPRVKKMLEKYGRTNESLREHLF